jgi:hypothetical protein
LLSIPPGTKMVHFPGLASTRLFIQRVMTPFYEIGFPHSDIPRSQPVCGSLRLIAACHVLHRLPAPRHPPSALSSLTIKFCRTKRCKIKSKGLLDARTTLESIVKEPCLMSGTGGSITEAPGIGHYALVELKGFEPSTPWLQTMCSSS